MGDEELINLVKQYNCIYNVKCNEYRDSSLRNAAWEDVARQHGKSVDECKDSWNKLRNCYNNAIRRRQHKSLKSGKRIAPWRYDKQMSFLKPYMGGRYVKVKESTENFDDMSYKDSPAASPESILISESLPAPDSDRAMSPASNISYERNALPDRDNYLADTIEVKKRSQEFRQNVEELDEIDYFFLSMTKLVKKLPKLDQIKIKMNLHKAVSEAEIKQLELKRNVTL